MPEKVSKSGQAPEKGPGKYRKRLDPGEYRKGGIRASTENVGSGRVPKMWDRGRVPKRWDPGKYQKGGIRASTENVTFGLVPGK